MSSYGLGKRFAKLFHSVLPLAIKSIAPVTTNFASSRLHDWGSEKDFKEYISLKLRSGARPLGK